MDILLRLFTARDRSQCISVLPKRPGLRIALLGFLGLLSGMKLAAELPSLRHATVVIAHRGEHLRHHENTLEAIQGAIDAGADFTELDVRRSIDGKYLLMHDDTVDRMTDGHGRVADLTWAELSKLKVQSRPLTNVPPSRIPLFEEALKLARGKIHIYVDFKAGNRAIAADIIRAAGMGSGVLIYDSSTGTTPPPAKPDNGILFFDNDSGVAEWRRVAPEMPVITSPPDRARTNFTVMKAFIDRYHPDVLDRAPDQKWMAQMQALPVKIWPDIQRRDENPEYWQKIWDLGFRGFQTDHPAELVKWLERTGRR
jgi:glycerophosphoryl diester phosphodiesterase